MTTTLDPEKLTPETIKKAVFDYFPGLQLRESVRFGRWSCEASIWRFRCRINLTQNKLMATDEPGAATFVSEFRGVRGQLLATSTRPADSVEALRCIIQLRYEELGGIQAALEMACSPPPPPPQADIHADLPEEPEDAAPR